jgi:hypothetical protein
MTIMKLLKIENQWIYGQQRKHTNGRRSDRQNKSSVSRAQQP